MQVVGDKCIKYKTHPPRTLGFVSQVKLVTDLFYLLLSNSSVTVWKGLGNKITLLGLGKDDCLG